MGKHSDIISIVYIHFIAFPMKNQVQETDGNTNERNNLSLENIFKILEKKNYSNLHYAQKKIQEIMCCKEIN